ncbi:uncharacterized protein LOC142743208 [Rhinoderma darwinii]|uniref:uncharacterized protein LOC142743208 n=1 Tax=Rhinoderma darwinii TaxID=43563 RepID=UPI003F6693A4
MKKNSSMQGTLNKLFGKKNANNNSLYANNPPWILSQGAKKASVDYNDEVHNSFAFLDDSGTATLKSRPGPRVRPVLHFSTSNTDTQGLAVPTPSVPAGFTDNASLGNDSKLNGNYRMYSSVGDLRLNNYYDDYHEIPAPPSMPPPPPPPIMAAPPPPPQKSPPSSAISSPASPSPPDFIPPTPNFSAPMPPSFLPTNESAVLKGEQHQTNNVAKWKSETVLNAESKGLPMTLPNRFSLNPAAFQHNQGQTNFDVEPQDTLPKSFKIPPPAPTRTSSMQLQEPQNFSYSKDPPKSPVPSSFNPSFQAKLFTSSQGQHLNKRKSMLIMEDLPDLSESSDHGIEKSANITDLVSSRSTSLKDTNILHNPHVELNNEIKTDDAINDHKMESVPGFKDYDSKQPYKRNNPIGELSSLPAKGEEGQNYSQNGTERNTRTINKHGYTQEMHKSSKPTIKYISLKPIIGELSLSNSNRSKHDSLTRKEMDIFPQQLTRIDKEVKPNPESSLENVKQSPLSPPPMAPPPPPPMTPPNQRSLPAQNITPQKISPTINSTALPPAPLVVPAPVVRMPSPLLSPKPKTIPVTPKPLSLVPPQPPKAPPAPPPLPNSVTPSRSESSVPLLEALQAKQQTLKNIPKSIEVRPAQTKSISSVDDEQKNRVGKIKGELEALFSPKKDENGERLKNSHRSLEANKNSNENFSHSKGGENKLVNSLMLKVPLLPAKFERGDLDADNSEWLPKSNKIDIRLPEPDYLQARPVHKTEKSTYSEAQNKIPKATLDLSVPSPPEASLQKDTNTADVLKSSIPTYKPHRETKVSTESSTLDELPLAISKPDVDVSINRDSVPQYTEIAMLEPPVNREHLVSQAESTSKHQVTGEQVEANSPMALLMAAQKRAQKAKSSERGNLPKISVTSGLITCSPASLYNEGKGNTFVVSPNKVNVGQYSEEEVTSFTNNSFQNSDSSSVSSTWRDRELQSSDISRMFGRNSESSSDQHSVTYVYSSPDLPVSSKNQYEEYLTPKPTFNNNISTTVPNSPGTPFNISSFPSPIPGSKMDNEIEYGIIPPPAEFMNSPVVSNRNSLNMQQDRSYHFDHGKSLQSDLISNYDRNNSVIQPFVSLSSSNTSGFNNYSSDHYNPSDSQRGSLIKKRLYMPEPESSRNYGKNISSIRSSTMLTSYSNMYAQSSSNMVPDPRRSNTTSRFLPQSRRVSSENISRMVPPMTDMKYKSPNSDYSVGKSSTRSQSQHQPGMTFTVRPGTRQPISQMYQGGYM